MGTKIRTVNVYLTRAQTEYLATDPDAAPGDIPGSPHDLVITRVDDVGGIFVEQASCAGYPGSGVWVDAMGVEHQGPSTFAELNRDARDRITELQEDAKNDAKAMEPLPTEADLR